MREVTINIVLEAALDAEVRGSYVRPFADRRLPDGTYEPGGGGCIERMQVLLVRGVKRLDITSMLDERQLREIEEDALDALAV